MALSNATQFFLKQQLVPGLINGAINGAIAWSLHRGASAIGLWERGAYATDLLATGFLLPAISWFILRPLLRHQHASAKAPPLDGVATPLLSRWMRPSLWGGALIIGLLGAGLLGGGAVLLMQALGAPDFSAQGYAWFKGAYAALLTAALQPVMVFAALASVKPACARTLPSAC